MVSKTEKSKVAGGAAVLEPASASAPAASTRKSKSKSLPHYSGLPTAAGVVLTLVVLIISAGATFFLLTRPTDDQALLQRGQHELAIGQYAFAVKTFEQAAGARPNDPKVYLALARAYVGVDQVEKAWQSISHAQQLGTGLVSNPPLTSELASYYSQHHQYERAVDLLRPLAQSDMAGKKTELSDLLAQWGDESLHDGQYDRAAKCWEEVRDLKEGTRLSEADARLVTIYEHIANEGQAKGNNELSLSFLNKLNSMAPNASNFQKVSEIYERQGKLELAIDQLRRAIKLSSSNAELNIKLAYLMTARGKELLDSGDTGAGYGYLQQAKSLDPRINVPTVMVRRIEITVDPTTNFPKLSGQVWNAGSKPVNDLNLKLELVEPATTKVLWQDSQKIIDDFTPPLDSEGSRAFDFTARVPVKNNGSTVFNVYLNGDLYRGYPVGQAGPKTASAKSTGGSPNPGASGLAPTVSGQPNAKTSLKPGFTIDMQAPASAPQIVSPSAAPKAAPPIVAPEPSPSPAPSPVPQEASPEDQTMKDLDR